MRWSDRTRGWRRVGIGRLIRGLFAGRTSAEPVSVRFVMRLVVGDYGRLKARINLE